VCVVQDFESSSPGVRVLVKSQLVAQHLDAFLLDVHAEHALVTLIRHRRHGLEEFFPLLRQGGEGEDSVVIAAS